MAREELKMNLPKITLDDMFSAQETRDSEKLGKVINIKIKEIDDFSEHPFKVIENDEMYDLAKSIKYDGILVPAIVIVRKKDNGRYEMISGHRRKYTSELARLDTIPCIVKDFDDRTGYRNSQKWLPPIDDAYIAKIKSDLQRYIPDMISKGECPYCRGVLLKGIFSIKCLNCGRKF